MTTAIAAITVQGLRRRYGAGDDAFEAVRGVDLAVPTGTISALLGTNGAGKTSTLEVIEGLARPSGGSVRVLGLDPVADRARGTPADRRTAAAQRLLRRPDRRRDAADVGGDGHRRRARSTRR